MQGFEGDAFQLLAQSLSLTLTRLRISHYHVQEVPSGAVCFSNNDRGVELVWEPDLDVLGLKAFTPEHAALSDPLTAALAAVLAQLRYTVIVEKNEGGYLSAIVTGMVTA